MTKLICHKCGRYFDQETGEVLTEFVVEAQRDRDSHLCKECSKALAFSDDRKDEENE